MRQSQILKLHKINLKNIIFLFKVYTNLAGQWSRTNVKQTQIHGINWNVVKRNILFTLIVKEVVVMMACRNKTS